MRTAHLLTSGVLGCGLMLLVACGGGDEEASPPGSSAAGSAGASAGAGGKSAAGAAGKAGAAGLGGTSGKAGAAGATGGAAGKAGAAGATGGAAGKAGAAGATGGAAGKAGAGGGAAGATGGAAGKAGAGGGVAGAAGATGGAAGKAGAAGANAGAAGSAGGPAGAGGAAAGGAGTGGATAGGAGAAGAAAGSAGTGGAAAGAGGAAAGAGGAAAGAGGAAAGSAGTGGGSQCSGKANGAACDDGDACTTGDACDAGACVAGAPKVCAAADQCHTAGTCDPGTGACSNPTKPNGDPCDDSDACTQSDACQAGVCVGANPVVCPAAATCKTQGTCNPQTGVCSQPVNAPNLTPCDDGSACTDNDYCIAGSCFAGSPKACPWTDACHSGVCNPGTGACEGAQVPNNDPCVDGNACTTGDVCTAGVCGGAAACGVGAPTTVVISEVRSRLGGSGGDEFVELYNTTGAAIDISGWKLKFSNNGNTINTRATVPAGRSIPAYGHYLFAYSSYSGSVAEDQTYTSGGLGDNGGVAITTGADAIIDQVGFGASAALHEGTPLASFPNNNSSCYERRPGSGRGSPIDTGDNSVDFFKNTVCDPQNSGSQPTPAFSQSPGVLFFAGLNGAPVQASATIANTLSGSLTLQSASVSGPNAAEFSFVFASALPQTLASGGTLAVTVTHTPAASGRRFATLLITTSAGETQSLELMAGDAP